MTGLHTHEIAGVLVDKDRGLTLEYVIFAECDHDVAPFDLLHWREEDIDGNRLHLDLRREQVVKLIAADIKAKREEAQITRHVLEAACV